MTTLDRKWIAGITMIGIVGLSAAALPRGAEASIVSKRAALPPHSLAREAAPPRPRARAAPPATPAKAAPTRRRHPVKAAHAPVPVVLEMPEPEPQAMTWDDLFPNVDRRAHLSRDQATRTPCYDQIQGVGGLSPCPEVTAQMLAK